MINASQENASCQETVWSVRKDMFQRTESVLNITARKNKLVNNVILLTTAAKDVPTVTD